MLQVARLAPRLLGDSAALVESFLRGQQNPDGGFRDRAGESDLYYTVFGLEGLTALRLELPIAQVGAFLSGFGEGEGLDFVHLCCLARSWANLPPSLRPATLSTELTSRIETHRSADGGFGDSPGDATGSVYACFLATGAYQDLGREVPNPEAMLHCLQSLRAEDGGYANQHDLPMGLTPPTAAAATLLRHLDEPLPPELGEWLLARCRPEGGFFATPIAPIPDLLSTATALHALSGMRVDLARVREPCLDFVDSLWTNQGTFYGSWTDDEPDCEYTYYGLLALGHLTE
jgi:prenyltransferase beta subunit